MNKKIILIFIILISIGLISGGVYLKIKHEEKEKYYDKQKERIIIYMKYNVKNYKEIKFEEHKENPLDGFVITVYINNDNTNTFSAHMWSKDDYQFEYLSTYSGYIAKNMPENPKSVSEIKKEQSNKEDKKKDD
ncbi:MULTISPECIES: DUF1433 domain-containing protein [Staphylococcus]|uniref:DUF1433 domain-containing protein n=2 Tax=Bacillota TaxID=1239 RepID=UPI0001A95E81|nr:MULTISPECIES: DUF1433 domain-containing protein [Staphylococcus]AYY62352.1 DUF1433 domain-containing protein [Staphylococcus epidermidis]EES36698.1 hypothetical protein HMPREF0791_0681 [Staphylococcus epidermidis W23144]EJD88841.1 hypothetical protein HMPREF9990_06589 [Staphylococcus epidermidis NIHLM061]KAA9373063.1 DUF1433 domain-containing protein [Staphylococcus epidermidis]KAB2223438.1 DUF1433 domain-containing protein [Staphylococcus epidermidis]